MIRRIIAIFRRRAVPEALIARRALRLHNRNAEAAAIYEARHAILFRGRK